VASALTLPLPSLRLALSLPKGRGGFDKKVAYTGLEKSSGSRTN